MLLTSLCAFRAKLKSLTSSEGRPLLVKYPRVNPNPIQPATTLLNLFSLSCNLNMVKLYLVSTTDLPLHLAPLVSLNQPWHPSPSFIKVRHFAG